MELDAEIISIGDELTSGQRLDTNCQYLSQRLVDLGIRVRYHTTVGDELEDNIEAFRVAANRSDVVIATGGLGPTADDLTRDAISAAFHLPLELRSEALQHIEALFALRKRPMPERNRVQALFPRLSRIVPNPHGTAPGIDLAVSVESGPTSPRTCRIFALPGVPAEMRGMMETTVEPRLTQELGAGAMRWRYHSLKVFGIGESDVEKELPDLIARDRNPRVGITVSKATITLRIAAQSSSPEAFEDAIRPTVMEIRQALGLLVFGEGEVELHEVLHGMLCDRSLRLGVVEIGAGCRICHMLSGQTSSQPFGLRAARWISSLEELDRAFPPPNQQGTVDTSLEQRFTHVAEAMLREQDLDLCLVAGTYPSLEEVNAATSLPYADYVMSLARDGKSSKSTTVSLGGHPDVLYHRLAKTALNFLRLDLIRA